MKKSRSLSSILFPILAINILLIISIPISIGAEEVLFVSDRDEPGNYDIYSLDTETQAVRRLTNDPGIDNHPDKGPNGKVV